MRKNNLMVVLLAFSIFLGGCSLLPSSKPQVVRTSPTTSVTGTISAVGAAVSITTTDGKLIELNTRKKIDFSQYDGQSVTVTGEYSGTVLFVDKIE